MVRILVLLLWITAAAAFAQDGFVVFHSDPPGARILNLQNEFVGSAGDRIPLSSLGSKDSERITLYFQLPGYHPKEESLMLGQLRAGVYPSTGSVTLSAATFWGPLLSFAKRFWWLSLLAIPFLQKGYKVVKRQRELDKIDRSLPSDNKWPRLVGPWRIKEKLGAGGMATVLLAVPDENLSAEEAVAIKLMREEISGDENFRKRFMREVKVCKDLNHPGIVKVVDYGSTDEGLLYMAMEFVRGTTLTELIPGNGMQLPDLAKHARAIGDALQYAHDKTVVHRDLKPDNIMVTNKGRLVLMDFGLARSNDVTAITVAGSAMGTPAYMAPEQIMGSDPVPETDQYALGIIFYEMATGRRPFDSSNVIQQQLMERPRPPHVVREDLSEELSAVILKALEKKAHQRWANVAELVDELLKAIASAPHDASERLARRRLSDETPTEVTTT